MFNKTPHISLVDELTSQLREAIVSGVYPAGTIFNQPLLAEEFKVSRTPIREALKKLEHEGFVVTGKRRQIMVRGLDFRHLSQLYRVREVIDGLGARILAEQSKTIKVQKVIEQLKKILEEMESVIYSWDPAQWSQCNVDFHTSIVEATENAPLISQKPLLRMSGEMFYPAILVHPQRGKAALDEHYMILRAIQQGEVDLAENFARIHIRQAQNIVNSIIDKNKHDPQYGQKVILEEILE
ncbi:GntR family transcriptional regulator [Gottfriedia acidiceleris]|uniref:GntR family transcriptional regulator n=1 Tax=Gottfriedia acidiceleris TaxID=371036 RepID=UPI003D1A4A36